MQKIFIIGTQFESARYLLENYGREVLIKQKYTICYIIEEVNKRINTRKGRIIRDPEIDLYLEHQRWLYYYCEVIELILIGNYDSLALRTSNEAQEFVPEFHTDTYFKEIKRKFKKIYGKP